MGITNLLLARAGEGRISHIYSFSNFRFHVITFFMGLKVTDRKAKKNGLGK